MRRTLLVPLTAALALLVQVSAVSACLNDREINKAEREFKSTYEQPAPQYVPPPPITTRENCSPSAAALGVGLLAGAVVIGLRRPRQS